MHAPRAHKAVKTRGAHKQLAPAAAEPPVDAERARRLLAEAVALARSGKADAAERTAASAMAVSRLLRFFVLSVATLCAAYSPMNTLGPLRSY